MGLGKSLHATVSNWNRLRPEGPLGLHTDLTTLQATVFMQLKPAYLDFKSPPPPTPPCLLWVPPDLPYKTTVAPWCLTLLRYKYEKDQLLTFNSDALSYDLLGSYIQLGFWMDHAGKHIHSPGSKEFYSFRHHTRDSTYLLWDAKIFEF